MFEFELHPNWSNRLRLVLFILISTNIKMFSYMKHVRNNIIIMLCLRNCCCNYLFVFGFCFVCASYFVSIRCKMNQRIMFWITCTILLTGLHHHRCTLWFTYVTKIFISNFEMFLHLSSSPWRPKQFHRYDDFYIQCTYRIMFRFFSVVTTCYFVKANRVFPLYTIHYTRLCIVFQNVHNYYFIAFLFYLTMMLNCCRHKIVFSI